MSWWDRKRQKMPSFEGIFWRFSAQLATEGNMRKKLLDSQMVSYIMAPTCLWKLPKKPLSGYISPREVYAAECGFFSQKIQPACRQTGDEFLRDFQRGMRFLTNTMSERYERVYSFITERMVVVWDVIQLHILETRLIRPRFESPVCSTHIGVQP